MSGTRLLFLGITAAFWTGAGASADPCAFDSLPASGTLNVSQICSASINENSCTQSQDLGPLKQFMQKTLVVLIPGYHNEQGTQDYFNEMKATIGALGGTYAYVRTNSNMMVERDTARVCKDVSQAISSSGRPNVIIVGHSKGGSTAQYMFKVCPQVASKAQAVLLIDGVLHGSFYADVSVNKSMKTKLEASIGSLLNIYGGVTAFGDSVGGISLTTQLSEKRLKDVLRAGGGAPQKTFCISAYATPGHYGNALEAIGTSPGAPTPNDGIVSLKAQSDADVGLCTDLLTISDANHKTFADKSSDSNVTADCRKTFAGYVLNLVRKRTGK